MKARRTMVQFETVEKSREAGVLHIIRDALIGTWMVVCGLLLWPVALLGLFFWFLSRLFTVRTLRTR